MYDTRTLEMARGIFRERGPLYYTATHFFTKEVREAIYILYAFLRIIDDIVDVHKKDNLAFAQEELLVWKNTWQRISQTTTEVEDDVHPILYATHILKRYYSIPDQYFLDFFDSMIQDTKKNRYKDYEDLRVYMYGSASCVGGIICHILGFHGGVSTLKYAYSLGYAMQFGNFIRDIDEDYQELGRIYIPEDFMRRSGVTEEMIRTRTMTPEIRELILFSTEYARSLFREAEGGIVFLKRGRVAVLFSAVYYESILDMLRNPSCDVFRLKRKHPSKIYALYLFIRKLTQGIIWKTKHSI